MTDETDDEKPKLKSIDDYKHPDAEESKTIDFQKAKQDRLNKTNGPVLRTKFDFMNNDDYVLMSMRGQGDVVELHYDVYIYIENSQILPPAWYASCIGSKEIKLQWYDRFFGITSLEKKIEKVATIWMKEVRETIKFNEEVKNISKKFLR